MMVFVLPICRMAEEDEAAAEEDEDTAAEPPLPEGRMTMLVPWGMPLLETFGDDVME